MPNRVTPKIVLILIIITLLSLSISAVLFINGSLSSGVDNYLNFKQETSALEEVVDENRTFDAQNIKNIMVKTVSADVHLLTAGTNEIDVTLTGETSYDQEQNPYVTLVSEIQNDDTLYLEVQHRPGLNLKSIDLKLDIALPAEYAHNINISTISGNLDFSAIELDSFSYNSISGDLNGKKLSADNIELHFTSGTANINEINGDLSFESVSGDINTTYKTLDSNIEANTTSGNMVFYLPEDASFSLLFKTVSGNISTDFPGTITHSSNQKLEEVVGSGDNQVHIKTISGNVQIYDVNGENDGTD